MPVHLQEEYELVTMLLEREQSRLAGAATYSMEEIQQMTMPCSPMYPSKLAISIRSKEEIPCNTR